MKCKRCNQPIDEHEAGRELDFCVKEIVMGWEYFTDGSFGSGYYEDGTCRADGVLIFFEPSVSHNHAYQMEERIAELGLAGEYVNHLALAIYATKDIISIHDEVGMWFMVHATPLDRCKAMLMVMSKESE